jgi:pyruvate dehydrogenase E2 component (dihydrolipoamide acetyltransferase)
LLYEFRFPDIGEGIHEGQLLEWRCRTGDRVREGEILAVVETDKVVAEMPSPKNGLVRQLGAQPGDTIRVGQVLVRLELDEPEAEVEGAIVGHLEAGGDLLPESFEGRTSAASVPAPAPVRRIQATPLARHLAAERGIDLGSVAGSGPGGRVTRADVLQATPQNHPEERTGNGLNRLSATRLAIARAMEQSRLIPTALIHDFAVVEELASLRRGLNEEAEAARTPRLSFLPFFLKAAALGLRRFPLLNAHYLPEIESTRALAEVNIGIAVDGPEGLVVPVIRGADTLSLKQLQAEIDRLRAAAAGRTLALEALRGGGFTLTNFGSLGGTYGRPLILPPQVAILGTGRVHQAPVAEEGRVRAAQVLPLSLAFDHRVLDGAYATRFLRFFIDTISKPYRLFTGG